LNNTTGYVSTPGSTESVEIRLTFAELHDHVSRANLRLAAGIKNFAHLREHRCSILVFEAAVHDLVLHVTEEQARLAGAGKDIAWLNHGHVLGFRACSRHFEMRRPRKRVPPVWDAENTSSCAPAEERQNLDAREGCLTSSATPIKKPNLVQQFRDRVAELVWCKSVWCGSRHSLETQGEPVIANTHQMNCLNVVKMVHALAEIAVSGPWYARFRG
jgi:hypothetical protein